MHKLLLAATAALALLTGCTTTDTADVFPTNASAQRLGPVQAEFVRTGTGRGPVTLRMADGEVLTGEYRVAFSGSVGTPFSGQWSASTLVIRDGPVQFVAPAAMTESARLAAIGMLLDRGYGRATLPLAGDADRPLAIEFTWAPATPQPQGDAPTIEGQPAGEAERRPALELVWEQEGKS